MRVLLLVSVVPLLLPAARAQAVRGGDLVVTNYSSPAAVFRIDATGAVLPLWSGAPLAGPSGVCTARNRDVIVADFTTSSLVRIDAQTGAAAAFATGLGGPLRVVEMLDGDFAVTSNTARAVLRVTPAGAVTTLASGAPLNRPFGLVCDLDGSLLVADDLGRALHRVSPGGAVTTLTSGLPLRLPQGVALFPNGNYAVIDGLADAVFAVDRATNAVATWVATASLGVNPEGIVTDWSGGFFVSHSGSPGGNGVRAIDAAGTATALPVTSPPWTNPEDVALVPMVSGPTALATGPGALFAYSLDDARAPSAFYTLILSLSVYPGWQLPGDPRSMYLNIDPFFLATIGQNAPPFLVGWTGVLAGGTATASLDLTALPPGMLAGLTVHQQGLKIVGPSFAGAWNVLRLSF